MAKRKSKDDDWIGDLLKIGLGALAIYYLAKLGENAQQITQCPYCGEHIGKFARSCPTCRNPLTLG